MEEFPISARFLEHVSLVMDADAGRGRRARVDHDPACAPRGSSSTSSSCPAGRRGCFPHQRSLDENGRAGLEEERRLAYVGLTRARRRAKIYFAANRRIHGLWQTTVPSRFIDELPEAHVEVVDAATGGGSYGGYAQSRFANMDSFGSPYATPGWKRAQQRAGETGARQDRRPQDHRGRRARQFDDVRKFAPGVRVFHIKFGPGMVAAVDGNKLTIDFDKAGRKIVLESFVERRD